jgi:hypothetical protein
MGKAKLGVYLCTLLSFLQVLPYELNEPLALEGPPIARQNSRANGVPCYEVFGFPSLDEGISDAYLKSIFVIRYFINLVSMNKRSSFFLLVCYLSVQNQDSVFWRSFSRAERYLAVTRDLAKVEQKLTRS